MPPQLTDELQRYPEIQRLADSDWTSRYQGKEPWLIDNPIARWLIGGRSFPTTFLSTLDFTLRTCMKLQGGTSRARKLFDPSDSSGFWPTLMELHIGAWLATFAQSVIFRSDSKGGPDLLVELKDGSKHMVEIKSFQQNAFWGELNDRLSALASQHKCFYQLRFEGTTDVPNDDGNRPRIPNDFQEQMQAVEVIVGAQIERLGSSTKDSSAWALDNKTGIAVRWHLESGSHCLKSNVEFADPQSAVRILSTQLTERGKLKKQIENADSVIICVSKHSDLPEFYILQDYLSASDQAAEYEAIPAPVRNQQSLGNIISVAVSLDQSQPHLAFSLEMYRTDSSVTAKQQSLKLALKSQSIATFTLEPDDRLESMDT